MAEMVCNGRPVLAPITPVVAEVVLPRVEAEVSAVVAMAAPAVLTPLTQLQTPVAAVAAPHTTKDQEETADLVSSSLGTRSRGNT
jgi:hypothetical protein